ncbi:hypothetical protein HBNXHx_1188 [Haloferax volcanii]|nr:hypothetical protein HBNXHx_1188 [Haloferax alexandrinus]
MVSYSFGFRHGDALVGVTLLLTYTIVGFGFVAFPAYRWRWSGPNDHFWYSIVGVMSALLPILADSWPGPRTGLSARERRLTSATRRSRFDDCAAKNRMLATAR